MKHISLWALSLSVILHMVFTATLISLGEKQPSALAPLNIEIIEPVQPEHAPIGKKFGPSGPTKSKASLKNLDLSGTHLREVAKRSFEKPKEEISARSWTNSKQYLSNELTQFNDLDREEASFVTVLSQEIDEVIWDSPLLAEYGMSGEVFIQLIPSEKFQWNSDYVKVESSNRVLKVIGLRALRDSFKTVPLAELKKMKKNLHFRFVWTDNTLCTERKSIQNNSLSFCRKSKSEKPTFSAGEKTAEYISSLQYGFGAIEEIKKYNRKQMRRETEFDPFQNFKNDPAWNWGDT